MRIAEASWSLSTLPAVALLSAALLCSALSAPAAAEESSLSGRALIGALRHGGYVIVMRHAHAPETPPSAAQADPANRGGERQLDAAGQSGALAMGTAWRKLDLPIGAVWSSPTYRAQQTARLAGLPAARVAAELGDSGHSMRAATNDQARWLRTLANRRPRRGTDTVIVTQVPNIRAAFGDETADMKDGEALVLRPAKGAPRLVGRMAMDEWRKLEARPASTDR
jgi:phosphohistidine phosphatase SixA